MLRGEELLAKTTAPGEEIELILHAEHADPFHVLGAHPVHLKGKPAIAIRAFVPDAAELWVLRETGAFPLQRIHAEGFFEAVFPSESQIFSYRLRAQNADGHQWDFDDPYRFPPVLSDFDLHLLT
jgi:1,4-alpha-glucan branching enzyme